MTTTAGQAPPVGFIGLGVQGSPMARAIGDSGIELHVWAPGVEEELRPGMIIANHGTGDPEENKT